MPGTFFNSCRSCSKPFEIGEDVLIVRSGRVGSNIHNRYNTGEFDYDEESKTFGKKLKVPKEVVAGFKTNGTKELYHEECYKKLWM